MVQARFLSEGLGWRVIEAASGEQALEILQDPQTPQIDIIFMDEHMASDDMKGHEAIKAIRDEILFPNLIVGFTGNGRGAVCYRDSVSEDDELKDDTWRMLMAGADAVLTKGGDESFTEKISQLFTGLQLARGHPEHA